MRMLAEQETSSSAASARPARRMKILAEGAKVVGIAGPVIEGAEESSSRYRRWPRCFCAGWGEDPLAGWMRKWEEERKCRGSPRQEGNHECASQEEEKRSGIGEEEAGEQPSLVPFTMVFESHPGQRRLQEEIGPSFQISSDEGYYGPE